MRLIDLSGRFRLAGCWARLLGVLGLLVIVPAGSIAEPQRTVNVSLLVFSDIYELAGVNGRGGFAAVAGAIAAERARSRNVFVAMAGDTLSPSLMSGFDQGRHIVDLINMIRPDVFVPGNHEFDFGEAVFRARMSEARFPLLAANLRDGAGAPLPGFTDHRIIEIDGVKIGVFGLTDDESARRSSPGSLVLSPSIPAARAEAAALREAGADLIVAVSHSTWQDDLRLANLGVIDVILSGHDHNLWIGYDGRTVIAETQADGVNVVAVDLEIAVEAGESRTVTWRPKFRVIDTGDVQPDAAIEARVAAYLSALDKDLDIVAGTTATPLDSRKALVRGEETAIGNFIADAILAETGADIAIVNGGSIRGDRTYPAGAKLTRKDVFRELPFGNKVVVVELTGKDVREALENAVWFAGKGDGRFGQIAGARIVARKDAVPGTKLTSIMIGGQPLDDAKLYKVAANDYLTGGKDGYVALARGKTLISAVEGKLMVTVVLEAIQKAGSIAPVVDGRLKLE